VCKYGLIVIHSVLELYRCICCRLTVSFSTHVPHCKLMHRQLTACFTWWRQGTLGPEAAAARPEGPQPEARRAESGVEFLGRAASPLPPATGSEGALLAHPAGSGSQPRPPTLFQYF